MMDPLLSEVDCCRLCGFVFVDKRRKRNITGEFGKMFETVVGVEVLEGNRRAVCDTCRYRVEKSWKSGMPIQELQKIKRKHPISPLSSSKGDKETERIILRKKPGHRLMFDGAKPMVPITPNQITSETPLTKTKTKEVSCQTSRTVCHCRPTSLNETCVKVR